MVKNKKNTRGVQGIKWDDTSGLNVSVIDGEQNTLDVARELSGGITERVQ